MRAIVRNFPSVFVVGLCVVFKLACYVKDSLAFLPKGSRKTRSKARWRLGPPISVLLPSSPDMTWLTKLLALPSAVLKLIQTGCLVSFISSRLMLSCAFKSVAERFGKIWYAYYEIGSALVYEMSTSIESLTSSTPGLTRTIVSIPSSS